MKRSKRWSWRIVGLQWLHAGLIFAVPTASIAYAGWQLTQGTAALWMAVLAVTGYVATMLGITVGFHRLLAHRAFVAAPVLSAGLAILGSMAAQGAPIYWVSNHRRHHRYSDRPGDPHSPHRVGEEQLHGWHGFFHAHIGWMFTHELTSSVQFSQDLLQNRVIGFVNRNYWGWVLAGLLFPALVGAVMAGSWLGVMHGFIWGAGVRLFISYHLTSSINSITHLYGYRSYATPEQSRNNLWLGIPTLGEAWHNNHHAFPASARFGLQWWEVDVGWLFIRLLSVLRLASSIRTPTTFPSRAFAPHEHIRDAE